jgi:tetratricopeptide (TPR) repeat protein
MAKRPQKKKRPPKTGQVRAMAMGKIPSSNSSGIPWATLLQALVIAAAALWIYWPVLHGDWLWDDGADITDNPITRSPTGLWSIWFVPGSQIDYYPVKASVQWLQWHLWRIDTLGYHLTNVLLHIVGALLVWRLLSKFGLRLAWLGGLIFAIHPVQVESVAWIAELKNTLSLPPFLLAMCAWIDFDEHGKSKDYFLALGLFLVAMLCKTTMVMFPMVILLYAWWKRGRIVWRDARISAPFFLVSLTLGLLTLWLQHHTAMQQTIPSLGGIFSRLACAGLSLSFYFSKCFLPVELMPVYPQWTVDPSSALQFLPWLVLGGVICWLWTKRLSWGRHALLGLGFFLLVLAPFLGFNTISYMNFTWVMDHFLYIPIIGLIGLVVTALGQIENQLPPSFRYSGIGVVMVLLALMTSQSRSYAKIFANGETLWTYELQRNSEAWLAHNNLGYAFEQTGRLAEAMEQYHQTLRIKPGYAIAHNNLAKALLETGQISQAMQECETALQIKPDYAEAHNNLGLALQKKGRLTEAGEQYQQALQIKPDDAEMHSNLGSVLAQTGRLPEAINQFELALSILPDNASAHNNLGNALLQTGRPPEAIEQYQQALKLNPDYAEAHNNLGYALQQTDRLPEAIEQFHLAVQIKPDYAEAYNNMGDALQQTDQLPEAIEQFEQAVRLKPDFADAHNNLGSALLLTGHLPEATEQLELALQIKPDFAEAHNNLGFALFQAGRITEAMEQYEQALRINPDDASAHYNLGNALQQIGQLPEAIEQYQQALQIKPDYADARNNLERAQAFLKTPPAK